MKNIYRASYLIFQAHPAETCWQLVSEVRDDRASALFFDADFFPRVKTEKLHVLNQTFSPSFSV